MSGDTAGLIISWGLIIYFIFKFFSGYSSSETIAQAGEEYIDDVISLRDEPEENLQNITTSANDTWMHNLWRWADENNIENETIPRQKDKLMEVTVLQLFSRQLTSLPKEIGNLINLRELRLKKNELTKLPKEIGNLYNLEFLSLGWNQLTGLPDELENLSKLKGLWAGPNNFPEVPKVIWKLTDLTGLSLAHNKYAELPREIGKLVNLRILKLSGNNFTKLPLEIGKLTQLKKLEINRTYRLAALPPEIGDLASLESLWLYQNSISLLPKEIGNLSNLKDLYCHLNKLKEVPKEIGNLNSLLSLHLSGDFLTQLPKEIGNLNSLLSLHLSGKFITQLPIEIGDLKNLKKLACVLPRLIDVPKEIGDLTNLIRLDLDTDSDVKYDKKISDLIEAIKEKNKTHAVKNNCYLKVDMDHAHSYDEESYLDLSVKDIYTKKGTFKGTIFDKTALRVVAQNFNKEIEKIEKKLIDENITMDTFDRFKIRAAVDDETMVTARIMADGLMGFVDGAYRHYTGENPYYYEESYFNDLLNSDEPFLDDMSFAQAVLLYFKDIMRQVTKDSVLLVAGDVDVTRWGVTDFENFQKNHMTQIEKIIPVKGRKNRDEQKDDIDLQKNENVTEHKKIYLEVTLTPDRYLDHSGLEARKELFGSKAVKSLTIHHDSGNIYDSKAIKVFYDHTDIGFIIKQGTNGKVDDFCFEGNGFLEDVELTWENGKLILEKTVEKEQY